MTAGLPKVSIMYGNSLGIPGRVFVVFELANNEKRL
jgi:hypothetical protein